MAPPAFEKIFPDKVAIVALENGELRDRAVEGARVSIDDRQGRS